MVTRIQYIDQKDRQNILENNKDKVLIQEDNIIEGNFLIFSDTPRIEEQITSIKNDNIILMDAIATLYETILGSGGA